KKPGPKRKQLAESLRAAPRRVEYPYRSYKVSYKLRVLSYWITPSIGAGPTQLRKPTRAETATRFGVPEANLSRWKKEEQEGKFQGLTLEQYRVPGGGRRRKWEVLERALYEKFRYRRASGGIVRRGWFRRVSKELFLQHYPDEAQTSFCFSNGWFRRFLSFHQVSLRFVTNTASQLPSDFSNAILNWMRFNRRNSQLRPGNGQVPGDVLADVGRYTLSNIVNMDQTPLPFEYLEGRTYNQKGEKTIWAQSSHSGWDKRQATIQLAVFADGIPRVKPLVFFRGLGVGATILTERETYDPRVVVKFNPKAYANSSNMVEWLDEQLVPILEGRPTLLVLDLFGAHKTEEVLDTFSANDIVVSMIPGGCTSLVQPLDVSINQPFKDILRVEEERILLAGERLVGSMIGQRRVLTTWAVGEAWERFTRDRREVVVKAFRVLGISLPISSVCDQEISVKGVD
ncbi:hypothetical protein L873DRAFT_1566635, partial [Choiromyces venosus 120613-1]